MGSVFKVNGFTIVQNEWVHCASCIKSKARREYTELYKTIKSLVMKSTEDSRVLRMFR